MPPTASRSSVPLRVGLVGYGAAGRGFHAPLLRRAGLEVAAVATADPTRVAEACRDLPDAAVVPDLDGLLERPGLDLVVIASATAAHGEQAEQVIDAGLPSVVDKPLALDADGALRIVDLAAHKGVPLTVFQNRRYDPEHLGLAAVIEAGLVGEVWRAEYRWDRWRPVRRDRWRQTATPEQGGGLLLDLQAHLIDQAVLLHGEVETVYAELDSRVAVAEDDTFLACRHTSGVVSHLFASAVNGAPGPRARLAGSTGAYVIGKQVDDVSVFLEFANEADAVGWVVRGGDREPGPVVHAADQADFYRGVATALRSDDPQAAMPVDPRDSIHVLAVVDAARTSAQGNRVVPVVTPGEPPA
ncbi:MAG: Gfo/Idh/MocA family protein [Intrasporangium sp.]|uniref:Gfo/Idh/MocA family protein n=1 Tax=Intrasporangium sp. TaxID=1925024 RepID=UPI003F7DEE73